MVPKREIDNVYRSTKRARTDAYDNVSGSLDPVPASSSAAAGTSATTDHAVTTLPVPPLAFPTSPNHRTTPLHHDHHRQQPQRPVQEREDEDEDERQVQEEDVEGERTESVPNPASRSPFASFDWDIEVAQFANLYEMPQPEAATSSMGWQLDYGVPPPLPPWEASPLSRSLPHDRPWSPTLMLQWAPLDPQPAGSLAMRTSASSSTGMASAAQGRTATVVQPVTSRGAIASAAAAVTTPSNNTTRQGHAYLITTSPGREGRQSQRRRQIHRSRPHRQHPQQQQDHHQHQHLDDEEGGEEVAVASLAQHAEGRGAAAEGHAATASSPSPSARAITDDDLYNRPRAKPRYYPFQTITEDMSESERKFWCDYNDVLANERLAWNRQRNTAAARRSRLRRVRQFEHLTAETNRLTAEVAELNEQARQSQVGMERLAVENAALAARNQELELQAFEREQDLAASHSRERRLTAEVESLANMRDGLLSGLGTVVGERDYLNATVASVGDSVDRLIFEDETTIQGAEHMHRVAGDIGSDIAAVRVEAQFMRDDSESMQRLVGYVDEDVEVMQRGIAAVLDCAEDLRDEAAEVQQALNGDGGGGGDWIIGDDGLGGGYPVGEDWDAVGGGGDGGGGSGSSGAGGWFELLDLDSEGEGPGHAEAEGQTGYDLPLDHQWRGWRSR